MGSKERRERERQELRANILDAAREMFVTDGFDAVTMRSLAQRIEYSPTAIYLHFKDKESLLAELCRQDMSAIDDAMRAISEQHAPLDRMLACGKAYVRFALDHPNQYRLVFMMPKPRALHADTAPSEELLEPDQKAYLNLRRSFEELVASGLLKPQFKDPDLLAQVYFCGLHGIVAAVIAMGDSPLEAWRKPEEQVAAFVEALLNGLKL